MLKPTLLCICFPLLGTGCAGHPAGAGTGIGGAGGEDASGGHEVAPDPDPDPDPDPAPGWALPACDAVTGTIGVTFSLDGGATLAPVLGEPPDAVAYTFDVALSSTPGLLYADVDGTVMRSNDAGCHWETLGEGQKAERLYTGKPDLLYGVASWGAFRYSALGAVDLMLPVEHDAIEGFVVNYEDGANIVFASGGDVMESVDGGASFTHRSSSPWLTSFAFASRDPAVVIATAYYDPNAAVYTSTDFGATWNESILPATDGGVQLDYAVSPLDPKVMWVLQRRISDQHNILYYSDDGGATFEAVWDEPEAAPFALNNGTLAPSPTDPGRIVIVGKHGIDSAISVFDRSTNTLDVHPHPATHLSRVAISPADDNVLYVALSYVGQTT